MTPNDNEPSYGEYEEMYADPPEPEWSVAAGDPCDVCGAVIVTACLPCEVKYCREHYRAHGEVCPYGQWPDEEASAASAPKGPKK